MSETMKPQFFISRQNGSIVPLIAMDELPHHIRVEGVSRTMTVKDTVGMTNIGEVASRHSHYTVIDTNKSTHKLLATQTVTTKESKPVRDSSSSSTATRIPVDLVPVPQKSYGIQEQPPTEYQAPASPPLVNVPPAKSNDAFGKVEHLPSWKDPAKLGTRTLIPGKKVYCTHWMSTGECDYAQQGCLYKHEMPFDLKTLNLLGYQDIPRWYREKHGIGKLTATPGSGAAITGLTVQSSATHGISLWRGYAAIDGRPSQNTKTIAIPVRDSHSGRKIRAPKNASRQLRAQRFSDYLAMAPDRALPPPRAVPRPVTQTVPVTNTLYDSKSAAYDPHPTPSPTNAVSRIRSKARDQYFSAISRRSSLFSDAEADLIRENDARREREEREYEETKRNFALAKLNASAGGSEGSAGASGSGDSV